MNKFGVERTTVPEEANGMPIVKHAVFTAWTTLGTIAAHKMSRSGIPEDRNFELMPSAFACVYCMVMFRSRVEGYYPRYCNVICPGGISVYIHACIADA